MTPRERFFRLLKNDILKLNLAELNFGIYRILNARRDLVLSFLDKELPVLIEMQLAALPGAATEDEEARIYAALDTFFHRYWDDGDFILRPRRGRGSPYSIPYDGSDVYFHWATKGSHYVKSGEFLKTYAFKPDEAGGKVRLEVVAAQQEKDNVKGAKRYFVPDGKAQDGATLVFRFEYRPLTEAEAKKYEVKGAKAKRKENGDENGDETGGPLAPSKAQDRLLRAWLDGSDFKGAAVPTALHGTDFKKHVARYVRKQTSDFFVHPQLGPFLEGELDYFLKNEFLQLWDRETPEALARERAKFNIVRDIGRRIIGFLHQIEDFQARLFEKRKFILKTDWLVMASALAARKGGKALVDKAAASKEQVAEWRQWVGDNSSLSGKKLLEKYPHLPIHTAHFDEAFVLDMLGCFEDIEADLGGVLIRGENYAALRTLETGFRDRVQSIYIDPPYNTDASPIDYKNGFRESSWLSLVAERIRASRSFLTKDGVLAVAIDDTENTHLRYFLEETFPDSVLGTVAIRSNPSGRPTKQGFSVSHEYMHLVGKTAGAIVGRMNPTDEQISRFSEKDSVGPFEWRNLRREGSNSDRDARRALFYPLFVTPESVRVPRMIWDEDTEEWEAQEKPKKGEEIAWPIDDKGNEKTWRWSHDKVISSMEDIVVRKDRAGRLYPYYKRRPNEEGVVTVTSWFDARYSATEHGTALLKKLFGKSPFKYPKSVHLVSDTIYISGANESSDVIVDYFGGSGTTAHAVLSLNRQDGGGRRFVLMEQGEYFDTVLLPRVAKVITCPDWKNANPKPDVGHIAENDDHWSRRTLPLVKVLRIERYEDSLDALESREEYEARRAGMREMAGQDYIVRYLLEEETRGSALFAPARLFESPFSAQLPVHTPGGVKLVPIDLAESALAMLGLRLVRVFEETFEKRRYRVMAARNRGEELQLVVLRDLVPAPEKKFWERDYRWLVKTVETRWGTKLSTYARIWHNGDTLLLDGETGSSLDAEFARVMQERDPHAAAR
jgi:adenine-specific DNA-methyltransferase